jgi:hypothetical protein
MKKKEQTLDSPGVSRFTLDPEGNAPRAAASNRSERGVALVITLILLSIITFMAITLLVVTRSEKNSVSTTAEQNTAALMNDAAIENFKMLFIAPTLAFTNPFNFDFVVSTNYVNPVGFIAAGLARTSFTNVNYDFRAVDGKVLSPADSLQNLQNLLYAARPPVYITNRLAPPYGSNEFRYYLDLNRNNQFDATGIIPVIGTNGPILGTNGLILSNYFAGDPQWIGVLEKPGFPHSATNRFIGRYAYFGVPLSQTLDLNYIHNYGKELRVTMLPGNDSFFRNMGVGTWELNLAAFLVDLNTNIWQPPNDPYNYYALGTYLKANTGVAFEDALSLLRYRYAANYGNLLSVNNLFGLRGTTAFLRDGIDGYTHGVAALGTAWKENDNPVLKGWPGADNTNYFFAVQDLFDRTKTGISVTGPTFSDRLIASTTSSNTYDRTTYYRLLSQLSTESSPESDRINLNYSNVFNGVVIPNAATNFIPWDPTQFFTNVAIRLLANAGYTVGTPGSPTNLLVLDSQGRTNLQIPISYTNYYTPSVHRLLQLAANIYDATTTNLQPTAFRPLFQAPGGKAGGNNVFIVGYQEVTDIAVPIAAPAMRDANNPNDRTTLGPNKLNMVYGIPLVIGAKKGIPNFNQFSMETAVSVTRKMQFRARVPRDPTVNHPFETNQMYVVSISNVFGLEAWNSYSNAYPQGLRIIVDADMSAVVTNELGKTLLTTNVPITVTKDVPNWQGFKDLNHPGFSFQIPLHPSTNHFLYLSNSTYRKGTDSFGILTGDFERSQSPAFAVPHWWLVLNTRLRCVIIDTKANRIVDYVNLASADPPVDITYELMKDADCASYNPPRNTPVPDGAFWCTNRATPQSPTFGSRLQIDVSAGLFQANWTKGQMTIASSGLSDEAAAKDFFATNMFGIPAKFSQRAMYLTNVFYAPFTPTRTLYISTSWEANDPLVHYTVGDLLDNRNLQGLNNTNRVKTDSKFSQTKIQNMGQVNERYEPWGNPSSKQDTMFALEVKDPLVTRSDDWDFPTNRLPTIGSMGRIHRGTPWQTLYLKSKAIDITNWMKWTGNLQIITNFGQIDTNIVKINTNINNLWIGTLPATNLAYDLSFTYPTNDWGIPEMFTTAFNDNAARGRLSVNQTNLPAWSALFSGIVVLEADPKGTMIKTLAGSISNRPVVIEPVGAAGNSSPLWQLYSAINRVRSSTNFNGAFKRVGDILAVPEFSDKSPFLNLTNANQQQWGMNDAACERLPQQTLSLLTLDKTPRYLIYSWGQALKPANKSIVTSGTAFGMCTNYQITAETATRTIVRLEGLPNNPHMVVEKFNVLPPD